ncbi:hypothetical protein ELH62_32640 (plasmid) [Rhizobium ruizarguesonis]|uniref:tetratricopeptide repeat protein n=1 Tax=Rhizobium ruizarguesonis TaxID=2081791 RepID=UPI0010302D7E|nr:hypothetical protein [Rhizobium ruizarguesonis]TBA31370.1 hypothetical protein ELH62_32640 [Rhizobium ruizarguesonis]
MTTAVEAQSARSSEAGLDYTLAHLAYHLNASGMGPELEQLVAKFWLDLQVSQGQGKNAFLRDVSIAMRGAYEQAPDLSHGILQVWRGAYVCACLRSTAGIYPSGVTRLLARAGRIRDAMEIASLISDAFMRSIAFSGLAEAAGNRGEAATAVEATQRALEAAMADGSVASRAEALGKVAARALEMHDDKLLGSALDLLSKGRMGHWMGRILAELAAVAGRARQREVLERLLAIARSFPEDDADEEAEALAAIAGAMGRLEMASGIAEIRDLALSRPSDRSGEIRLLTGLIDAFAASGNAAGVESMMEAVNRASPNNTPIAIYASVAQAYFRLGERAKAESMLDAVRDAGCFEDEISDHDLRRIAEAWAHLHQFARGFETIEAMRESRLRAEGLLSLGRIAVGAQDPHLARDIAARALAQARFIDVEDIYNSIETLLKAAEFAWEVRLHEQALGVAREALADPWTLCDPIYGPAAFDSAVRILAPAGARAELEFAIAAASSLDDSTFRYQALSTIVEELAKAGDVASALRLAAEHEVSSQVRIAEAAFDGGHNALARDLVDKMVAEADTLPFHNAEAIALSRIAHDLALLGAVPEAEVVTTEALRGIQSMVAETLSEDIGANGQKAMATAQVALTLSRIGRTDNAVEIALAAWSEANPREPRFRSSLSIESWMNLVKLYGRHGQVMNLVARVLTRSLMPARAMQLAQEVDDESVFHIACQAIIQELSIYSDMSKDQISELLESCADDLGQSAKISLAALANQAPIVLNDYEEILRGIDVMEEDPGFRDRATRALTTAKMLAEFKDALCATRSGGELVKRLGDLALILQQSGRLSDSLDAWRDACLAANREDRATVLILLQRMAPVVAELDNGKTLFQLFRTAQDVAGWWRH